MLLSIKLPRTRQGNLHLLNLKPHFCEKIFQVLGGQQGAIFW